MLNSKTMKTFLLLIPLLFAACTAPSVSESPLTLMQVVEAFDKAQLPVINATVFDEQTDPNKLLGRPNRYTEKMNFYDARDTDKKRECSIEIFRNHADAKTRFDYIEGLGKEVSWLGSYNYLHKNVLVRISYGVLPKDAEAYKQALTAL